MSQRAFLADLDGAVERRMVLLPAGAVGTQVGGQVVTRQEASGAIYTPAASTAVFVRVNGGRVRLRGLDLALALPAGLAALVLLALLLPLLWAVQGRPLFHGAARIGQDLRPFRLWKLRSMAPDPADRGVTGGDKAARITRAGAILRRTSLDELPQLWNVIRGEMSLVGPRPPLPRYVERFPGLYAQVLAARPGLTGLATLACAGPEARMLARCRSAAETEALYERLWVPRKARLDLIYLRRRSLGLDLAILARTLAAVARVRACARRRLL